MNFKILKKMNKIISTLVLLGGLFCNAQEISDHAIGLRIGDNDGLGAEISYQKKIFDKNRLEFDLGWRNNNDVDAYKLVGLYQWVKSIDGNFNWYYGLGGGIGSWSYNKHGIKDSGTFFLAAGNIGVEYLFDFPLQLSLDLRPELYFGADDFADDNFGPDIALGVRYRF